MANENQPSTREKEYYKYVIPAEGVVLNDWKDAWYENIPGVGSYVFEIGKDSIRVTELFGNKIIDNIWRSRDRPNHPKKVEELRDYLLFEMGKRRGQRKFLDKISEAFNQL